MIAMKCRPVPHPILNEHWKAEHLTPDQQRQSGRRMIIARRLAETALTPAARARAEAMYRRERDRLALIMLPWIVTETNRRFGHTAYPIEDLIASAIVAVMEGLRTYDPAKGAATTHLGRWAWKGMWDGVQEYSGGVIRIPRRIKQLANQESRGRLDPSTLKPKIRDRLRQAKFVLGTTQADDVPLAEAAVASEAEAEVEAAESARRLREAIDTLDPRTRTVIEHRFGLAPGQAEKLSLTECGRLMELSHEMIRRIEREGLVKIRRYMNTEGQHQ